MVYPLSDLNPRNPCFAPVLTSYAFPHWIRELNGAEQQTTTFQSVRCLNYFVSYIPGKELWNSSTCCSLSLAFCSWKPILIILHSCKTEIVQRYKTLNIQYLRENSVLSCCPQTSTDYWLLLLAAEGRIQPQLNGKCKIWIGLHCTVRALLFSNMEALQCSCVNAEVPYSE